jgi:hypothetical protein
MIAIYRVAGNLACSRLSRRLAERSSDAGERSSPRRLKAGGSQDWPPHRLEAA